MKHLHNELNHTSIRIRQTNLELVTAQKLLNVDHLHMEAMIRGISRKHPGLKRDFRNRIKAGYELGTIAQEISHLDYMNNLKLISSIQDKPQKLIAEVKTFGDDIRMRYGNDK